MPPHVGCQDWNTTIGRTGTSHDFTELRPTVLKSISFNETTSFREILPLSEISDEEMTEVWYNEEEYAEIKKHVTETIKRASDGGMVDEADGYCMRGLEGRTKFGARRRKNNKAKALDAVWTTQIKLWKDRLENPLVISAAYKPHSTNAKYPAIAVAHNDEKFVQDHVRPVMKLKR